MKRPDVSLDLMSGLLFGQEIVTKETRLNDLKGVFLDESHRQKMDQDAIVYKVQAYMPVKEDTPGGLFFGNTILFPGKVGNEYFMTRGHFHAKLDTAEYYWCIRGEGVLIFMDTDRKIWTEVMRPGSLHYIAGKVAHRVANTGSQKLVFNACWPSDAGHDYDSINTQGFQARHMEENSKPELVIL